MLFVNMRIKFEEATTVVVDIAKIDSSKPFKEEDMWTEDRFGYVWHAFSPIFWVSYKHGKQNLRGMMRFQLTISSDNPKNLMVGFPLFLCLSSGSYLSLNWWDWREINRTFFFLCSVLLCKLLLGPPFFLFYRGHGNYLSKVTLLLISCYLTINLFWHNTITLFRLSISSHY